MVGFKNLEMVVLLVAGKISLIKFAFFALLSNSYSKRVNGGNSQRVLEVKVPVN